MADIIQTVKDANGKSIDVNISKICDINGDSETSTSIKDSAIKNRINFEHKTQIVDSKGNVLDSAKLLKDIKDGNSNIVALDVDMEATHSGKNHNYCIYYEDSMEKDSESFMNPFHKPVLKNHDDYCEPIGRITQSYAGPSELTDERSAIHLKTHITDQDAIPKFIDGRYGTVSIGGSMGTVVCNICGKTILKDGKFHFCGHWRGETYKDQVCYWGARDIEYHEVSIVNNPADDFAQIMKVTVLTDKDTNKDNKEENSMGGSDSTENNVDNIIDQTLNTAPTTKDSQKEPVENQDGASSSEAGTTTDADATGTPEDDKGKENQQEEPKENSEEGSEGEPEENSNGSGEEPKEGSDDQSGDSRVEELEKQLKDANEKIESLQTELIDAQSQIQTITKTLEECKTEKDSYKQRCVALATANKETLVDSIMANEKFSTDDAREDRKKDLMIKSMKELKAMKSNSSTKPRDMASVTSPCLAVDNQNEGNSGKTTDTDKETDNKIVTVNDAAQQVIEKLFNK